MPVSYRVVIFQKAHVDRRKREKDRCTLAWSRGVLNGELRTGGRCSQKTFDDLDLRYPGGESSREAMQRALPVIQEVIASSTVNAVLATHGNLLSLLLKHYDDSMGYAQWQKLTNPDVYQLTVTAKQTKLQRIWSER